MDSRKAFSLVELLVVLSVIGVLLSITLPAVQQVRESARRTACSNNLRQIGIGLNHYHAAFNEFPPGGVEWRPWNDTKKRQLAWSAFLLPYVEQSSLFEQIDFDSAFDSDVNAVAAAAIVPLYICPSGQRGADLVSGRGPADYGGIFGERISSPNQPPKGLMVYDVSYSAADIRDGLSSTIIVAEDTGWQDGQWINGRNLFDQAFAINQAPAFENDIRSEHSAGANVCFADGHVQFLSESMDLIPLAALCTRAGGEIITDW